MQFLQFNQTLTREALFVEQEKK